MLCLPGQSVKFQTSCSLAPLMLSAVILVTAPQFGVAQDGDEVNTERSGLVYSIGRVDDVIGGGALIDMGDAHNLSNAPPLNKVALFRSSQERYIPVGVMTISETYATHCRTAASPRTSPQPGDIVMAVRELSQLKTPDRHQDDFIKLQIIKNGNASGYSTMRRSAVARTLRDYAQNHKKWVRSRATILGFLNGESWSEGREVRLKPLLDYIGLIREDYRAGRNSLSAAGRKWDETVKVLYGQTTNIQHKAAQPVEDDPNFATVDRRPPDRDIRRMVREHFFDHNSEQQNLLAYLVATLLEYTPRNQEVWFQHQILKSQFPELGEEDYILDQVRLILQEIQEGN